LNLTVVPVLPTRATVPRRQPSPELVLAAVPRHPSAGSRVRLELLHSPAGSSDYRWDLDGSAKYATDTGSSPWITHVYATAGVRHVAVRVTDGRGTRLASLKLTVLARPERAIRQARIARHAPRVPDRSSAQAAVDPALTISDFQFTPSTITVHVGDTITWTNNGPSAHTATARGGSFDSGTLHKGQSASHTFTQPGTFAYYCRIHPFMHGTVVVLAARAPSTPSNNPASGAGGSTGSSRTARPTAPATAAGRTLPMTGLDVTEELAVALVLLGVGLTVHRSTLNRCG
jgi:plastocyanin